MALVVVWDSSKPAGTDDPRNGDDEMRDIRAGIVEGLLQGGIYWESNAVIDQNRGKICTGIQAAEVLRFFEDDKTTVMAEWDSTGGARKLTLGDGKTGVRPYKIVCDELDVNDLTVANAALLAAKSATAPDLLFESSFTVSPSSTVTKDITVTGPKTGANVLCVATMSVTGSAGSIANLIAQFQVDRGTGSFVTFPSNASYTYLVPAFAIVPITVMNLDTAAGPNTGTTKYRLNLQNTDAADTATISNLTFVAIELVA